MTTNPYNTGFGAGFIEAKVSQMRKLVCRLETRVDVRGHELDCLQEEIKEIEAEVKLQVQMTRDERLRGKVTIFMALLAKAQALLKRYEQRATALTEFNEGIDQDEREHVVMASGPDSGQEERMEETRPYVSENEEEIPLKMMSRVDPTSTFIAVNFEKTERVGSEPETRRNERCMAESYGVQHRDMQEPCSSKELQNMQEQHSDEERCRIRERGRMEEHRRTTRSFSKEKQYDTSEQGSRAYDQGEIGDRARPGPSGMSGQRTRGSCRGGIGSGHDRKEAGASRHAIQWLRPQEEFSGPVRDRTYPPIMTEPPMRLRRGDINLIGMSEMYVRPRRTDPRMCPICAYNRHKLYRCARFLQMSLEDKWHTVLMEGLCLNCLIHGHSHFTCRTPGACYRCGKRHNSQLCPLGPHNG